LAGPLLGKRRDLPLNTPNLAVCALLLQILGVYGTLGDFVPFVPPVIIPHPSSRQFGLGCAS